MRGQGPPVSLSVAAHQTPSPDLLEQRLVQIKKSHRQREGETADLSFESIDSAEQRHAL